MLKQLFFALALIILVGILSFGYQYRSFFSASSSSDERAYSLADSADQAQDALLDKRVETSEQFKNFAGEETGTKYQHLAEDVAAMEQDILKSKDTTSAFEMLFKKGVYYMRLASNAVINIEGEYKKQQTIVSAYDGLYDGLVELPVVSTQADRTPRMIRILMSYTVHYVYQMSDNPSLLIASRFSKDPAFKELIARYPNNEHVSAGLYLDLLIKEKDLKYDNMYVSYKLRNLARLLSFREVREDVALFSRIKKEIEGQIELFPTANQSTISKSRQENESRPIANFATALGVIARYTDLVTLERAEQVFQVARKTLVRNFRSKEDVLRLYKAQLDVQYASLLFRKNGGKVDEGIRSVLKDVLVFADAFRGNKEITYVFSQYLKRAQTPLASWDSPRTDLFEIAKQDKEIEALLKSYGLSF
jgi:hypothetical protein